VALRVLTSADCICVSDARPASDGGLFFAYSGSILARFNPVKAGFDIRPNVSFTKILHPIRKMA
jgi:hypothetical protein